MAKALQAFSSCSSHQFVMYFPWWYKTSPLEWIHLMKRQVDISFSLWCMQDPKRWILYTFLKLAVTEAAQNGNAQLLPSHHSQCTSSSHKEHGCSMRAVNRNRGGKGKNKKVHKQDWHLYAGRGGKRCLVSTGLHCHTNTKPKENNAVCLGFHKLRSGRNETTATSFCNSSNFCKLKSIWVFSLLCSLHCSL